MSYKGRYKVKNLEKYKGDPTSVTYRSLWERKFMLYCDDNPSVLKWSSEEIVIPYRSPIDKKVHRYFPDFWIQIRNSQGIKEGILIEVKPKAQTNPPKKKSRETKR